MLKRRGRNIKNHRFCEKIVNLVTSSEKNCFQEVVVATQGNNEKS